MLEKEVNAPLVTEERAEVAAVPVWVTEPEEVAPVLIRELEEEAEVLDISNLQPINSHHYRPYP